MEEQVDLCLISSVEEEFVPSKGNEFESEVLAYYFYNEYARRSGFGNRREYGNRCKKSNVITSRRFVCAKQGIRMIDKRDSATTKHRAKTRCGCEARVVIMLNRDSEKYAVTDFVPEHNHYLHSTDTVHMIPSQRKIQKVQAVGIDLACDSEIRLKESHQLFSNFAGGFENVGFTKVYQKNYLRTKRQKSLKYGEAGCLERYFHGQLKENPSYLYALQLDVDEQITNIFWADARMIIDYNYFGDVLTFDTTYSTNKSARPLGVFLGLNHHEETVVFGAALLYDETIESFIWLFETFLEAMSVKHPTTIFTEANAAMGVAIKEVMPSTCHALCSWHMWHNALKHLGNLLKGNSNFSADFSACIYEYDEEDDFLISWNELLCSYNLKDNIWLRDLFKLKEKWAQAYVKRTFTAGMRNTQLSERFNADLKYCLRSNLDIVEFMGHFNRVVNQKRYKELEAEYNSRQKFPRLELTDSPMLKQISQIYTPKLFEAFQNEVRAIMSLTVKCIVMELETHKYIVGIFNTLKEYKVSWYPKNEVITCCCKLFETCGILCRHALKVFDTLNIKLLAMQYVMKRWSRNAKDYDVKDTRKSALSDKCTRGVF